MRKQRGPVRSYAEISADQGKTRRGKTSRFGLSREECAVVEAAEDRSRPDARRRLEARNLKKIRRRKSKTRPYAAIVAAQGLTKSGVVNRHGLSRVEKAVLDRGAPSAAPVESLIHRNESFVLSLLRRTHGGSGAAVDTDETRAARAHGHLVAAVNMRATLGHYETVYEAMARLGLTDAEQERIGPFDVDVTIVWS